MSKSMMMIMSALGILMMFSILGIGLSSTSQLLTALSYDGASAFKDAEFWSIFLGTSGVMALIALGAGIAIGFLTKTSAIDYAIATPITLVGGWVLGDLWSIMSTIEANVGAFTWITGVARFVITLLMFGLIWSLISFWRGSDG
jgi:hypothetical protein